MSSKKITNVIGRMVFDSRGYPTVEAEVQVNSNFNGVSISPSGASKGKKEALEKRDANKNMFLGNSIDENVFIINNKIKDTLVGINVEDQISIDKKLIELKKNKPIKILQSKRAQKKRLLERTEVKFDNSSSATYTVLEVITNDRPALLYDISRILLNKRLVISMAKISTNGDFVEDSFHLRNEFGMKIDNKKIMLELQKEIIRTLKEGLNNVS